MTTSEQTLTLTMTTIQPRARCPRCHHPPTRSHSRYVRTRADLPWLGNAVCVELQARRFFCRQPACLQQICCERWPAVVAPDARRTTRLAHGLQVLSLALGGEAGARVAIASSYRPVKQ